jgi:parallel beta-helix repeat protein
MCLESRIACLGQVESKYTEAARTIVVPDDFAKIQDAIDNATPGDTVYVKAGVYPEQLWINKSISLIGENETTTVVETSQYEDTITITADNVSISGFTIRNTENSPTFSLSYGIKLSHVNNTTISGNTIMKNLEGVGIIGGSGNMIEYNWVAKNRYGIFVSNFSRNNVISHNYVSDSDWNGIELDWVEGNVICANTIVNSTAYGLEIPFYAPSYYDLIFDNNFIHNVNTVVEGVTPYYQAYGPTPNSWDNGEEGNYWSDYKGIDANNDGIGDTPYLAIYGTADRYPLMGNFSDFTVSGSTVTLVSDSLLAGSGFSLNGTVATLSMSIYQETNSTGFCRVSIPKALMADPYEVKLDGAVITPQVTELPSSDAAHECLYFNCSQGEHSIEISATAVVPELAFSTFLVFFLIMVLMMATLLRRRNR